MITLYQKEQIRELESLVTSEGLDDEFGLMSKAGLATFELLQQEWPDAQKICVCCGKGNNAGDALILARLAFEAGLSVSIFSLVTLKDYKGAALKAAQACIKVGLKIIPFQDISSSRSLTAGSRKNKALLDPALKPRGNDSINFLGADVIVDGLLGIGISGEITGIYAEVIEAINESKSSVLAIDVPSGVDVNTGAIYGTAVRADVTMTFIALKQGLFTHKAPCYTGRVFSDDLGIPDTCFEKVKHTSQLLNWQSMKTFLPRRERDAHKGKYGHVLVIGGDYGMGGAVRMAAESAMRVGAGLVTVATRPEHVSVVNTSRPEIMCHEVTKPEDLIPLLKKATVVVIGPGLGKTDWAKMLLATVLSDDHPKLLDADALNLLSENQKQADDWILTPHPGEASRLLNTTTSEIQEDRFSSVKQLQKQYGGIVVLKGVGSIIQAQNDLPSICPAGNPGMATGGMGDVLSGVIGGFMAQGLDLKTAAELGVLVHAIAADIAAEEGGERGLLATDLMLPIRELVNPEESDA